MNCSHHAPGAQTVGRATLLLKLVGSSRLRDVRLVDIANMASLDKSTTHRLLRRLVYERLLTHRPHHGYRLGPLLYELGLAALPETSLREVSREALSTLAQRTGDAVSLVRRSGFETVCLARITGHFPIQTMTRIVGDRHPIGVGAGGLAILARLSDSDVERIINTIRPRLSIYGLSDRKLAEAVEVTRQRGGLAVNEGHAASSITALARTIPNGVDTSFAAVVVASLSQRMMGNRRCLVDTLLQHCVGAIARCFR